MEHLKIFINLTRLNKPIGIMLLFWPCSWGLAYAYKLNQDLNVFLYYLLLFFLGSLLMRSAGCIFNDIVDKDLDKRVERTKTRPIASGKISIFTSFIYIIILCLVALLILLRFNSLTVILGLGSMLLAFTYPFMKRFTYWPQLFLGITFNYGLILGWTSINSEISLIPVIFYFGAIFWTLGYDTIYGFQDIIDDEIIGLKSTSIKFKSNPNIFLFSCYTIFLLSLLSISIFMEMNKYYLIFFVLIFFQMFFLQLKKLDIKNSSSCLKTFKSNNFLGLLVFLALIVGKL